VRYEDEDEEHLAFETLAQLPLLHPETLVGRRVSKHFPGFGRFEGTVVQQGAELGYSVEYQDGDTEDLSQEDVLRLLLPPAKPLAKQPSKHKRARGAQASQKERATSRSRSVGSEAYPVGS